MQWKKGIPFAHSSVYRQPNRAGNSHVVGKVYSEAGTITTEHFLSDTNEKGLLLSAKAVCGTIATVTEIKSGASVTHANVFIESVRQIKGNVCVGPGGTVYIVILEWTVYLPEDWS
jgi:hypothetical protein